MGNKIDLNIGSFQFLASWTVCANKAYYKFKSI